MKIFVHAKEKIFTVHCGDGAQNIRWLGDTAVLRYSDNNSLETGYVEGMRLENGKTMELNMQVNEVLTDGQHVWTTLKDDLEWMPDDPKKKKQTRVPVKRK